MRYLGSILMLVGAPMAALALILKFPTGVFTLGDFGWYPYVIAILGAGLVYLGYRIDRAVLKREAHAKRTDAAI